MKCHNCKSENLVIFSPSFFWEQINSEWFNVTPFMKFDNRESSYVHCKDCERRYNIKLPQGEVHFKEEVIFTEEVKPKERSTLPKKIVLDLDHTLICSFNFEVGDTEHEGDFSFVLKDDFIERRYEVIKRPHLEEFIKFCKETFEVVEVCTASTKDYARFICDNIGLGDVQITSRESLSLERTLMSFFDTDYIKDINDAVVVDDKIRVIRGTNNIILNPKIFWVETTDTELIKIMDYIKTLK